MHKSNMNVSVTKNPGTPNAKREVIGAVAVFYPTLTEIAAAIGASKQAIDDKGQSKVDDEGMPIYDTNAANWIQTAINNAVKMAARNKLEPQSVNCKDGLKIAENMDELTAESTGGNNGEGLAILREAKEAFTKYVATLGKTPDTAALLVTLFSNRQSLTTQAAGVKEKMRGYVEQFSVTLSDEQAERFTRPIEAVIKGCDTPDTVAAATDF